MNAKRALQLLLAFPLFLVPHFAQASSVTIQTIFLSSPGVETTFQLDCNDGHDAVQESGLRGSGETHSFVITDFTSGSMDCTVTHTVVPGWVSAYFPAACVGATCPPSLVWDDYEAEYWDDGFDQDNELESEPGLISQGHCEFSDIEDGADLVCFFLNLPLAHRVDIFKHWIDEQEELNNPMYARGRLECADAGPDCLASAGNQLFYSISGARQGKSSAQHLQWSGEDDWDSGFVCPAPGGAKCWVTEKIQDSSVETDTSDCSGGMGTPLYSIKPGDWENTCTVVNTRIYEGVPTLSQYGLGILALLMLGVGMVGFRRFA